MSRRYQGYGYQEPEVPGYLSMFTPMNTELMQQNLQGQQQRYDQTSAGMLQFQGKLAEEAAYDPAAKQALMASIQTGLQDVSKRYNGDMGAAGNDILANIVQARNNPYFQLNDVALAKQKEQDALKIRLEAEGKTALEFSTLPQGLKNDKGEWRKPEEFKHDIQPMLEYDNKRVDIWTKLLKQQTQDQKLSGLTEAQLSKMGPFISTATRQGVFQTQVDNKLNEAYDQYKTTPEYKQELRKLKELDKFSQDPDVLDAELKKRMLGVGTGLVIDNTTYKDMGNPVWKEDQKGRKDQQLNPDIYTTEMQTTKSGEDKMFNSAGDILSAANSSIVTPKSAIATDKVQKIIAQSDFVNKRNEIRTMIKGMNEDENKYIKQGELVYTNYNKKYTPKLVEKIDEYNTKLREALKEKANALDYKNANWTHVDRNKAFRIGGKEYETYADVTMKNTVDQVQRIGLNGFTWEDSPYTKISKFSEDDFKSFDVADVQFTFDEANGMFAVKVNTKNGKQHIGIPKGLTEAVSLARAYGQPEAIKAAVTENIQFVNGSSGYFKKVDGIPQAVAFNKPINIEQQANGSFTVTGSTIPGGGFIALDKYALAKQLANQQIITEPELEGN